MNRLYFLAGRGMLSLTSQGINSANNFVSGIILGRLCPKEEYGLYALGFSLIVMITDFQSALISTPYMVYSPRLNGDDKRKYAGSTLSHQLMFSALVSLMLLAGLGAVYSGMAPQNFTRVLEILAIVIVFIMLKDFIRQMCFISLNVKAALILDSVSASIQIGGLSILAYFRLLSADRAFIVVGIACGVTSIAWLFANKGFFMLRKEMILRDFQHKWALVKWMTASQLLWTSSMGLYPWILATYHGVKANGEWAACVSVIMLGNLVCVAVQNMLGPKIIYVLAREGISEMRGMIFKSAILFVLAMSLVCIFFVVFGNPLVVLFYGHKYEGNGYIVSVLALNLVMSSATFPFSRGLFAMERADLDFMINLVVIITLLFGVWLVRAFGPLGAAYGLFIANALSVLLRGIVFNRVSQSKITDMVKAEG